MNLRPGYLQIVVADRNLERAVSITNALTADGHHVMRAHDATSVLVLAREHTLHAVLIDPDLVGAQELALRLRRGILPASSVILALTGTEVSPETCEGAFAIDYQLPPRFDVVLLSGLIHYARKTRP
jgi:DNA-binding response OmpR family regulator